jgi:cytoskeletal protein CcmA (bactofilin family)
LEEVPLALFGRTNGAASPEPAGDETPAPKSAPTVVGPRARIVGDLSGEENVLVQGRVEGSIRVAGGEIAVGPGGEVEGEIRARTVVIGGKVRGEIVAEEKAELLASAFVQGKVQAPRIVIAEGAQLEGNVAMSAERSASPALQETEG